MYLLLWPNLLGSLLAPATAKRGELKKSFAAAFMSYVWVLGLMTCLLALRVVTIGLV